MAGRSRVRSGAIELAASVPRRAGGGLPSTSRSTRSLDHGRTGSKRVPEAGGGRDRPAQVGPARRGGAIVSRGAAHDARPRRHHPQPRRPRRRAGQARRPRSVISTRRSPPSRATPPRITIARPRSKRAAARATPSRATAAPAPSSRSITAAIARSACSGWRRANGGARSIILRAPMNCGAARIAPASRPRR